MSSLRTTTSGYSKITVPVVAGEAISVGRVVYFQGATAGGLPVIRIANASTQTRVDGQLAYHMGTTAASANAIALDNCTVMTHGLITGLAGAPTIGDPVFVDDTGIPSLVAGTYIRQIGEVLAVAGGFYSFLFSGGQVRPFQSFSGTSTADTLPIFTSPYVVRNSYVTQDANDSLTLGKGLRVASRTLVINDGATVILDKAFTNIRIERGTVTPAARNVQLPGRPNDGFVIVIKDADNSAGASNINITTSGIAVLINRAAAPYTLTANGKGVVLIYDYAADNWDIVAQF